MLKLLHAINWRLNFSPIHPLGFPRLQVSSIWYTIVLLEGHQPSYYTCFDILYILYIVKWDQHTSGGGDSVDVGPTGTDRSKTLFNLDS